MLVIGLQSASVIRVVPINAGREPTHKIVFFFKIMFLSNYISSFFIIYLPHLFMS
jgi:hypothetical protein